MIEAKMDAEQITKITNAHYRKLNKHLKKITEDFDAEAIHQFRVEYKKLRAFLRMISQESHADGGASVSDR